MSAFFIVENCIESNELPEKPTMKHAYDDEMEGDEDYPTNSLFSIVYRSGGPPSVLRSGGKRPKVWVHYISAEEVMWDYSPQSDGYDHASSIYIHWLCIYHWFSFPFKNLFLCGQEAKTWPGLEKLV